ncbi:MAG: MBG domain-containing protein, partial [Rhodobacterales bacterium]|nr:MBG domain-containing protein [Rhodobacterales bacterium]
GLIGRNVPGNPTPVSGSFWDMDTSGLADGGTPALGRGLSTAQFEDTDGFFSTAGGAGWDFGSIWAPGAAGRYPALYTIDRVVFARADPVALSYGETLASVNGPVAGGPAAYVFALPAETLDTAPIFSAPVLDDRAAGSRRFSLDTTPLISSEGETYAVVALEGRAEISPALLTLKADDATKTYGTVLSFDGTEFTVADGVLFYDDSVDTVALTSAGAPADAPVAGSPYVITAGGPVAGAGLGSYVISYVDGALTVDPAPVPPPPASDPVRAPDLPEFELPNPRDSLVLTLPGDALVAPGIPVAAGTAIGTGAARDTLALVREIAATLEIAAAECGQSSADLDRYLACISDALEDFASGLDAISADLPP